MGFLGIGGKNSKQQNQAIGNLNNLFSFGLSTGKQETSAGNQSLDTAGGYFNKIASGNRAALQQAVAPEANAVQKQADAARRQQAATGTARGGGVASTNQTQKDQVMAQIDNALFGVRPTAAAEMEKIGGTQLAAGEGALNTAGGAASNAGKIATDARQQAAQEQAAAIQTAVGAIFG